MKTIFILFPPGDYYVPGFQYQFPEDLFLAADTTLLAFGERYLCAQHHCEECHKNHQCNDFGVYLGDHVCSRNTEEGKKDGDQSTRGKKSGAGF